MSHERSYWRMPLGFAVLLGLSTGLANVLSQSKAIDRAADTAGNVLIKGLGILWNWAMIPVGGVGFFFIIFFLIWGLSHKYWDIMRRRTAQRRAEKFLRSKGYSLDSSQLPVLLENPDPETRKSAAWVASKEVQNGTLSARVIGSLLRDQDIHIAAEGARILEALRELGAAGKPALFDRLINGPPELREPILSALGWVRLDSKDKQNIRQIMEMSKDWPKDQQKAILGFKKSIDIKTNTSEVKIWPTIIGVFLVVIGMIGFIFTVALPALFGR
jgi:hypothetical protein